LSQESLEANRYQLASSATSSDVTVTISLHLSPPTLPTGMQKLHDVFVGRVSGFGMDIDLSTEVFHGSLQSLQSRFNVFSQNLQ